MEKQRTYLIATLLISFLSGTIPLVLGIKDLTLITICFSSVWFIYAVIMLILTFLVKPRLKIKASRQNGVTVVRYELLNARKKKWGSYKVACRERDIQQGCRIENCMVCGSPPGKLEQGYIRCLRAH